MTTTPHTALYLIEASYAAPNSAALTHVTVTRADGPPLTHVCATEADANAWVAQLARNELDGHVALADLGARIIAAGTLDAADDADVIAAYCHTFGADVTLDTVHLSATLAAAPTA